MVKKTKFEFTVNELIQNRWSPRAFSDKKIEKEKLQSIFEAARWSASAFNAQPWRFIVAYKGDENHQKIVDSMVEFNQLWASKAPVLVLNCYAKHFSHNAQPNPTAQYDLGQAVAYYSLEATDLGLFVHQMTGFDAAKAHKLLALNDEISVFSVTAMGYLGQVESLPEDMQKMENAESPRMPQKEFLLNAL